MSLQLPGLFLFQNGDYCSFSKASRITAMLDQSCEQASSMSIEVQGGIPIYAYFTLIKEGKYPKFLVARS